MIYVFLAEGFEEIEAVTIVDVLRRAQLPVQTVGVGSKIVTGAHDITVHCDITEEQVDLTKVDMIVLPGGMPGTINLANSAVVQVSIDHAAANDLWLAAICAAPTILADKGLLDGKKATVFPSFEARLANANLQKSPVAQDGKIITANGPAAALEFSLLLVEHLIDKQAADTLAQAMQWGGSVR